MTYEQFRAADQRAKEMHAAQFQPLDVAVLAIRTDWPRGEAYTHVPGAIVRHGYFARRRAASLPAQLHESHAADRGS